MSDAEKLVAERAERHLPTRMRVRHPDHQTVEVAAYSRQQAELMAAMEWQVGYDEIADEVKVSVVIAKVEMEAS